MENKQFLSLLATKSFVASSQPRMFSTETPKATEPNSEEVKASKEVMKFDSDDYDDYEPQTKKEKVDAVFSLEGLSFSPYQPFYFYFLQISYYGSVILRLLFLAGGLGLAGFTILELFPGRTSPNSIFSEVFDLLQNNDSVRYMS